jgi:hypothetical protein
VAALSRPGEIERRPPFARLRPPLRSWRASLMKAKAFGEARKLAAIVNGWPPGSASEA